MDTCSIAVIGLYCLTLFLAVGFDQALAQTLDLPDKPIEQAVIQPGFAAPAAGSIVAAPNPDHVARPPVESRGRGQGELLSPPRAEFQDGPWSRHRGDRSDGITTE